MYWIYNNTILDPKNVLEDFISTINLAFRFTGTLTNMYYTNDVEDLHIQSEQTLDPNIVYHLILAFCSCFKDRVCNCDWKFAYALTFVCDCRTACGCVN